MPSVLPFHHEGSRRGPTLEIQVRTLNPHVSLVDVWDQPDYDIPNESDDESTSMWRPAKPTILPLAFTPSFLSLPSSIPNQEDEDLATPQIKPQSSQLSYELVRDPYLQSHHFQPSYASIPKNPSDFDYVSKVHPVFLSYLLGYETDRSAAPLFDDI